MRISWVTCFFLTAGVGAGTACTAIFGDDFSIRDDSGGSTTANGGTASGGGSPGGGGGSQGQPAFAFAIKSPSVNVPYGGKNFVLVEVIRSGGLVAPIEVIAQGAPPGFVTKPLTIASDGRVGELEVGATGTLVLGTKFDLELRASAGSLSHTDTVPAIVTGKPGTLDQSFGTAGLAAWTLGSDGGFLPAIREVAQDKILVAGSKFSGLGAQTFAGARLLPSGMLDTSFDGDGIVGAQFCGCTKPALANGIARTVNGNVYLSGWASPGSGQSDDIALLRLLDDGSPDDGPKDGGKNLFDLGAVEHVRAMAPNDKEELTVTGERDGKLFVARIGKLTFGSLDTTFAAAGYLVPSLGTATSEGQAIAIDAARNAIVAGWVGAATRDLVVVRLTPAGALDASFAGTGIFSLTTPGEQSVAGVAIQPDGSILVVGTSDESGNGDFIAWRLTAAGSLDSTFGKGGVAWLQTPAEQQAVGMALMLDGRVVIAGNDGDGPLLARLRADGSPDPTFGTAGMQSVLLGSDDRADSITLDRAGKTLLAGTRQTFPTQAVVARIYN